MKNNVKTLSLYASIFICLFAALSPVLLSDNYIRQDDLMWEIWPWMKISDFGYLYYNTVWQLLRPICMLSFYVTDLISIDIHNAVYVRLFCITLIGILGVMLYHWQTLFHSNKLLAATFAISTFTLPGYQVFAATGNYSLIITALLLTFLAVFYWQKASCTENEARQKRYNLIGNLLFFASFLDYPLSSMFAFAMILIVYLSTLTTKTTLPLLNQFWFKTTVRVIALMVVYYLSCRLFHFIFQVNLSNGRSTVIDTAHIIPRLLGIFNVMIWHSELWLWDNTVRFLQSPLPIILLLFISALIICNLKNGFSTLTILRKNIQNSVLVAFMFFFLAYSPIMANSEVIITYRYTMVTMPILLYIGLWSINEIMNAFTFLPKLLQQGLKLTCAAFFISLTVFGVSYANLMLADGIVGPHDHDFNFVQKQLTEKVLPLLKQKKKVLIYAEDCTNENTFAAGTPTSFEYGMRICQYQQQIIGVVIHSLRKMGYASNFNTHNKVIYKEKEIIVEDTPWGTLIVADKAKKSEYLKQLNDKNLTIVNLDMHNNTPYQPFELYQKFKKRTEL